jgi:hypothetical protein
MASMSSSNESTNRGIWKKINRADVWMVAASGALLVGYLSIRTRISNYVYVAKWLMEFVKSFFGT